jgi:hypothetical protein
MMSPFTKICFLFLRIFIDFCFYKASFANFYFIIIFHNQ